MHAFLEQPEHCSKGRMVMVGNSAKEKIVERLDQVCGMRANNTKSGGGESRGEIPLVLDKNTSLKSRMPRDSPSTIVCAWQIGT